jgi:hypothetical protein
MRRQLGVTNAQGTGSVATFCDYCARAGFAADLHRRHIKASSPSCSVDTQSIAAGVDMSVARLRSEIDKNKTDNSPSGIERRFENVVRWCVIAVALTLAGFFGAFLLK